LAYFNTKLSPRSNLGFSFDLHVDGHGYLPHIALVNQILTHKTRRFLRVYGSMALFIAMAGVAKAASAEADPIVTDATAAFTAIKVIALSLLTFGLVVRLARRYIK